MKPLVISTIVVCACAGVARADDPATTELEIKSTPPGAVITLDNVPSGATDRAIAVTPGRHIIQLDKPGFVSASTSAQAENGKTVPVAVTLTPIPGWKDPNPPPPPPVVKETHDEDRPLPMAIPLTMAAVGGAALVTGAVLAFVVDQDPPPTGKDRSPTYRDTAPLGVGLMIGGAVVGGIGAAWWLMHHGDTTPTKSAPVVFGDQHAGGIGWTLQF